MIKKLLFVTLILVYSCSADYDVSDKELANSTFEPYFEIFKEEAKKRGHNFDDYEIQFFFGDINNDQTGAFANYDNNEIIFDRDNWNFLDSNEKEEIVFHELGHSILKRGHSLKKTDSGECLSYMIKTREFCFKNLYSKLWREYYLDELFNKGTPLPNWYLANKQYNINYSKKIEIVKETDNTDGYFNYEIATDTIPKFVLEVTFKNWLPMTENYSLGLTQSIDLQNIYFISQPRLNFFEIGNYNADYYFKDVDYSFEDEIKFTIRKNENLYQFFINEEFIHVTDSDLFTDNSLEIEYASGLNMDIELFSYE